MGPLPAKEFHELMLKKTQHDTQPNDAFETGYCLAEQRLLPALEKCVTDNQTLVDECNERGRRLEDMTPLLKRLIVKFAEPLLADLERDENKEGIIYIGEDAHTYPEMARFIRDLEPRGIHYVKGWMDADDYLKRLQR